MAKIEVSDLYGHPFYCITADTIKNSEQANKIVDLLEQGLKKCPVKYGNLFFHHSVIIGDQKSNDLPLQDWSVFFQGLEMSENERESIKRAFQPGWFWLHVGALEGGWDVVERWVSILEGISRENTDDWGNKPGLWEDEDGVAIGESALLSLVMREQRWLPLYTRLLKIWDLGHEVHTRSSINAIVRTHGWSAPMADLLVQRVAVDGQHGPRQVFGDLRGSIKKMLTENDYQAFYARALGAQRWS